MLKKIASASLGFFLLPLTRIFTIIKVCVVYPFLLLALPFITSISIMNRMKKIETFPPFIILTMLGGFITTLIVGLIILPIIFLISIVVLPFQLLYDFFDGVRCGLQNGASGVLSKAWNIFTLSNESQQPNNWICILIGPTAYNSIYKLIYGSEASNASNISSIHSNPASGETDKISKETVESYGRVSNKISKKTVESYGSVSKALSDSQKNTSEEPTISSAPINSRKVLHTGPILTSDKRGDSDFKVTADVDGFALGL